MDHWRAVLDLPMLEVTYEDLVADPEPHLRGIIDFCGLDWDDACLRPHESNRYVSTASYQQVRQPIYTTAVSRARRYDEFLGPLRAALAGGSGAG